MGRKIIIAAIGIVLIVAIFLFYKIFINTNNAAKTEISISYVNLANSEIGYRKLSQAVDITTSKKITVVEFFSYACPYCNTFEPLMQQWQQKYQDDENLQVEYISVATILSWVDLAKTYLTLETMGIEADVRMKIFDFIHKDKNFSAIDVSYAVLDKADKIIKALSQISDIDIDEFQEIFNSPLIAQKVLAANDETLKFKVRPTPTLMVNNQYSIDLQSTKTYEGIL